MRCEHEHDDGAYVLGALTPAEREAYERHLATCSFCREAVRDIAALPDLLGRLDAKDLARFIGPSPSPARRRHRDHKTFQVRLLSTAAAAVLVGLLGLGLIAWARGGPAPAASPAGPAVAMVAVDSTSSISATVRLTSAGGGTKVDLDCDYASSAKAVATFKLLAYGPDSDREEIGSWDAAPGAKFSMPGVTHFVRGSLTRLELTRYDGKVLLAYDVP
jgi:hypothetical protein